MVQKVLILYLLTAIARMYIVETGEGREGKMTRRISCFEIKLEEWEEVGELV